MPTRISQPGVAGETPPAPRDLVERYYDRVFNLAYRTLGRREDAEDVAQQAFVRALPQLERLRDPAAAGAWLSRIAANLCMDTVRSRHGDVPIATDDEPAWAEVPDTDRLGAPAAAAELREVRLAVWRAALLLPPQQRLALALRELHAMSYAEIAEVLGTSVAAVETLLFRARQGFRVAYEAGGVPLQPEVVCDWMLERLSASIDDELGPVEQARVDAHLPRCPTCQFAARQLRATSRLYTLLPLAAPPIAAQGAVVLLVESGGICLVTATGGGFPALVETTTQLVATSGLVANIGTSTLGLGIATVVAVATFSTVSSALPATGIASASPPPLTAAPAQRRDPAFDVIDVRRYSNREQIDPVDSAPATPKPANDQGVSPTAAALSPGTPAPRTPVALGSTGAGSDNSTPHDARPAVNGAMLAGAPVQSRSADLHARQDRVDRSDHGQPGTPTAPAVDEGDATPSEPAPPVYQSRAVPESVATAPSRAQPSAWPEARARARRPCGEYRGRHCSRARGCGKPWRLDSR